MYNALYAIWTVYTGTTIGLVQSFLQHGDGDPLQRHVDTVEDAVSSAFDTLTYKSVASLPLHAKSVEVLDSFDRVPPGRRGVSVKCRMIHPPTTYDLSNLSAELMHSYSTTWSSVPDYVECVLGINGRSSLRFKPLRSGVRGLDDGRVLAGGRQLGR